MGKIDRMESGGRNFSFVDLCRYIKVSYILESYMYAYPLPPH